jgi:hypothetical protein
VGRSPDGDGRPRRQALAAGRHHAADCVVDVAGRALDRRTGQRRVGVEEHRRDRASGRHAVVPTGSAGRCRGGRRLRIALSHAADAASRPGPHPAVDVRGHVPRHRAPQRPPRIDSARVGRGGGRPPGVRLARRSAHARASRRFPHRTRFRRDVGAPERRTAVGGDVDADRGRRRSAVGEGARQRRRRHPAGGEGVAVAGVQGRRSHADADAPPTGAARGVRHAARRQARRLRARCAGGRHRRTWSCASRRPPRRRPASERARGRAGHRRASRRSLGSGRQVARRSSRSRKPERVARGGRRRGPGDRRLLESEVRDAGSPQRRRRRAPRIDGRHRRE